MFHDRTVTPSCTADLSSRTPAFVQAPTFVFGQLTATPGRSELLRRQIAAANDARQARM